MASATGKSHCIKCGKDKATSKCNGCCQDFCFNHLLAHREELSQQLDQIECDRDQLRDAINKRIDPPQCHALIDQWEYDSIEQIKRRANQCRQTLLEQTTGHVSEIEKRLAKLTDELRHIRQENDFNEIDLLQTKKQLAQLTEQLHQPPTVTLQHPPTAFISNISILVSSEKSVRSNCDISTRKWNEHGVTIAEENGEGNQLNQLFYPLGIRIDDNHQIYIADYVNHRIIRWNYNTSEAEVVAGGNGQGNEPNQLDGPTDVVIDKKNDQIVICDTGNRRVIRWPRRGGTQGQTIIANIDCSRVAMDNNGDLYVSDGEKDEVRRWTIGKNGGKVVAGGNEKGSQLNQLNHPTFIFVDADRSVYVSDWDNNRVMKWVEGAREGVVVAGEQGQGNSLTQLSHPQGVVVDDFGNVYVADFDNSRVMRWARGSSEGSVIAGGNGEGKEPNQFNRPMGLSFDEEGHLYVADRNNSRVQRFDIVRT